MARIALPAGTVTFLMTDIEGSTRLWQAHPDAMRAVVPEHYELLAESFARHGGVLPVEQGEGDSVLAAFSRASDALAAALEAQLSLHARQWPDAIDLRVRISLHTAEAQLRDEGNYFGVALSRCARIRAIANGGQTLLSKSTHELVVDRLPDGVELIDCGEHRLRDLGRPEHLFALAHPDLPAELEQLQSLDALPNNLPSQLTSFVGRERELEQLQEALAGTRLLTLTGAGGSGKTRLALQLAADVLESLADGVWLVELAAQTDPELVGESIAKAMGVRMLPGATPLQSVRAHVAERAVLVILDNCEHLLEACADVALALLESGAGVKVLATSRAPLGLGGETDWRVPALSLPAETRTEPVEALAQSDAVQLFIARAVKVRPNFAVTNENAPAVAQICSDLDGIPLALELAAARVRVLSVDQIASGLADRFHLLTGGARTTMPRQQTLRASVDWSHELLSEQERVLFRRLGAFVGGFTLDLAEQVCGDDQIDRYAVLDLLTALVDKSLVLAEDRGAAVRYGMLETVRQYAAELLAESEERDEVRDRHRDAMLALAELAAPELETAAQLSWLPVLDLEAPNLAAALDRALETKPHAALRLALSLTFYWKTRMRYAQADHAFSASVAAAADDFPELRCRVLWCQAYVRYYAGDFPGVVSVGQAALELARAGEDLSTAARAMSTLGAVQMWPDPKGGRALLEPAAAMAREAGDDWASAYAGILLASVNNALGRHQESLALLEENEPIVDRLGHGDLINVRYYQLGYAHMLRAEFDAFRAANERSREVALEVDDTAGEGLALNMAAYVDILEGRYESTIAMLEPMLARMQERGASYAMPYVVLWLAWGEMQVGRPAQAAERLERIARGGLDGGFTLAFALGLLAEARRLDGDVAAAASSVERGLEIARRLDSPHALSLVIHPGARLSLDACRWSEAEQLLHENLVSVAERWIPVLLPDLLDGLACVAGGLEGNEEAARILGAVDRARLEFGLPVLATERARRVALIESVRAALGEEGYERARAEGLAMDLEGTVEWVRRARGERKRPPGGWESLTPTELRVVDLACEGLTNAGIAERMFVSPATVKVHLAHVYAKLGVPNRAALATAAAANRPQPATPTA